MPVVRRVLLVVAAATVIGRAPPAGAAAVPVLVIEGRGHGHGVGMAQDGALAMGRSGSSTSQILSHFYPGTAIGRSGGEVRVTVLAAEGPVVVGFPNGGEVRDARDGGQSPGFPVRVAAGGQVRLRSDGRQYLAEVTSGALAAAAPPAPTAGGTGTFHRAGQEASTTTTTLSLLPRPSTPLLPLPSTPLVPTLPPVTSPVATTTTTPPAPPSTAGPATRAVSTRGLWAVPAGGGTVAVPDRGHRYRGVLELAGGPPARLVNHVDVEQYLRGMGEVRDPSWPAAGLRAQAIAARTYALRAMTGGGELCDSQQCQVYLGAEAEYGAMDRAVAATRGQVVMFRRALASTVYSANGGGFSATPEEGFGTPGTGYPYLRPARYPSGDASGWTVTVALRDVAARVGYRGRISAVRAGAHGPSGRVVEVVVEGNRGVRTVRGIDFDRALGLKSTLFTLRLGESAKAPPPPPPPDGGTLQALPGGDAGAPATEAAAPTASSPADDGPGSARVGLANTAGDAAGSGRPPVVLAALAWLLLAGVAAGAAAVRAGGRMPSRRDVTPMPLPGTPAPDAAD